MYRNQGETTRMIFAIKCGILENEKIVESIKTVLSEFNKMYLKKHKIKFMQRPLDL